MKRLFKRGKLKKIKHQGNSGCASEFNWRADPEAASIVLDAFSRQNSSASLEVHAAPKIVLVPWECTLKSSLSWEFFDSLVPPQNPSERGAFLGGVFPRKIHTHTHTHTHTHARTHTHTHIHTHT